MMTSLTIADHLNAGLKFVVEYFHVAALLQGSKYFFHIYREQR